MNQLCKICLHFLFCRLEKVAKILNRLTQVLGIFGYLFCSFGDMFILERSQFYPHIQGNTRRPDRSERLPPLMSDHAQHLPHLRRS